MGEPSVADVERVARALSHRLRKLGVGSPYMMASAAVYMLRAITAKHAPHGDLGARFTDDGLGELFEFEGPGAALVDALAGVRLLERSAQHRLIVRDWPRQAGRHVHRQVIRSLSHFANGERPRVYEATATERQLWRLHHEPACAACKHANSGGPGGGPARVPGAPPGAPAGTLLRSEGSEEDLNLKTSPAGALTGPPELASTPCMVGPADNGDTASIVHDALPPDPDRPLTREERNRAFERVLDEQIRRRRPSAP